MYQLYLASIFFLKQTRYESQELCEGENIRSLITPLKTLAFILALTVSSALYANPAGWFNIRDFGAKGDGKTVDTKAINNAIDAAAKQGGGTVYFPAGNFLSYSIHLKSNIALYLDQGCTLLAADSAAGGRYDEPEPGPQNKFQDYGHSHWHNSLIWG